MARRVAPPGRIGLLRGLGVLVPLAFLGWCHLHREKPVVASYPGVHPGTGLAAQLVKARPGLRRG